MLAVQEERMLARINECQKQVRSEQNRYYARMRLSDMGIDREPTIDDLAEQWEKYGGRDNFEKNYPAFTL